VRGQEFGDVVQDPGDRYEQRPVLSRSIRPPIPPMIPSPLGANQRRATAPSRIRIAISEALIGANQCFLVSKMICSSGQQVLVELVHA
jgi:hypothetical protein